MNDRTLLTITQATRIYFPTAKQVTNRHRKFFSGIKYSDTSAGRLWQVRDIDKYLDRHKS
ncbi:conserved hypothetical protein [Oenococcus oeni]|nr:conserved hypothetical protein [Oenococcus oeni]